MQGYLGPFGGQTPFVRSTDWVRLHLSHFPVTPSEPGSNIAGSDGMKWTEIKGENAPTPHEQFEQNSLPNPPPMQSHRESLDFEGKHGHSGLPLREDGKDDDQDVHDLVLPQG